MGDFWGNVHAQPQPGPDEAFEQIFNEGIQRVQEAYQQWHVAEDVLVPPPPPPAGIFGLQGGYGVHQQQQQEQQIDPQQQAVIDDIMRRLAKLEPLYEADQLLKKLSSDTRKAIKGVEDEIVKLMVQVAPLQRRFRMAGSGRVFELQHKESTKKPDIDDAREATVRVLSRFPDANVKMALREYQAVLGEIATQKGKSVSTKLKHSGGSRGAIEDMY